jgi:hypothetical protein
MTARSTRLVLVPGLACTEDLFADQITTLRGDLAPLGICFLNVESISRKPYYMEEMSHDHPAICSILLGTIFGGFYKVMVLVPAAALLFAVVCANFTILEFAVLSTCLLVGYASGLLFFIPEIRRRHNTPSNPRVRPRQAAARHPHLI